MKSSALLFGGILISAMIVVRCVTTKQAVQRHYQEPEEKSDEIEEGEGEGIESKKENEIQGDQKSKTPLHPLARLPDPIQSLENLPVETGEPAALPIAEEAKEAKEPAENEEAKETKPRKCIELSKFKRTCNEGLKGLLDYVVDRREPDGKMKVLGVLSPGDLTIYSGKETVKTWNYPSIKMPLETIHENCLAIRVFHSFPDILCAPSRAYRNLWINAIHEAILCKKNKGIEGNLPAVPGPELLAKAGVEEEEKPSGINIHIDQDESGESPELLINGVNAKQLAEVKKREVEALIQRPEISPKVEDMVLEVENEPEDTSNPLDRNLRSRTLEEKTAMLESDAEKKKVPLKEAPPYGFLALQNKRNKELHNLGMYRQEAEEKISESPEAT